MTSSPSSPPWSDLLARARALAPDDPTARYAQLASVDPQDGAPRCRTLVVREVDARSVRLVTDARSPKTAHLAADPRVELCWYLAAAREQFRLRGQARLLDPADPAHARLWRSLSPSARAAYDWPPPGTPRRPDDAFLTSLDDPTPRPSFAVLEVVLDAVDWLSLRSLPHERRLFTRHGDAWLDEPLRP